MIFLCGIPSELSLGMVIDAVRQLGLPHVVFYQREFAAMNLEFHVECGRLRGSMQLNGNTFRLEDFTAVYTRLMDFRQLPEIENQPQDSPARLHCAAVHDTIMRWYEIMPGRVLNRSAEIGVNYSKPYEAQLIQDQGFQVPETLVTNDPELVLEFRRKYGRIIYKSISYVRSIVKTLEDADLDRLDCVRACPTQFQRYIEGINVRVHTVGNQAFATAITADATDYRYAYLEGGEEKIEALPISDELTRRCTRLSRALSLAFAGVDLKIAPDGEIWCLEVNPCPAFSYYQRHTGQPIAEAVAKYLGGIA